MKTNLPHSYPISYFIAIILFIFSGGAFAQNTGWLSPSATSGANNWTNPGNAYKSDDVYTTVIHGSGCRCPFLDLSWNAGVNFTSSKVVGPYGTVDATKMVGSPTDTWGHAWVFGEFTNANFLLRIANPSTLIKQNYVNFNFGIPNNSIILGIEVQVEEHGDSLYQMEYVDLIQAKVYYNVSSGMENEISFNSFLSLSPNPATSVIHISANNNFGSIQQVEIYDLQGRSVKKISIENTQEKNIELPVDDLRSGMYLLTVMDDTGKMKSTKIVIE